MAEQIGITAGKTNIPTLSIFSRKLFGDVVIAQRSATLRRGNSAFARNACMALPRDNHGGIGHSHVNGDTLIVAASHIPTRSWQCLKKPHRGRIFKTGSIQCILA
jgi:hypothetical protein